MAKITVSNLTAAGSELFMDSESFLNDVTDEELFATTGGITPLGYVVVFSVKVSTGWIAGGAALGAGAAIAEF
ncbi:MAG: hypothetical protein AB4080_15555 [Trichodesmium sp.]